MFELMHQYAFYDANSQCLTAACNMLSQFIKQLGHLGYQLLRGFHFGQLHEASQSFLLPL